MIVYFDSSALVKRYVGEPGSQQVEELLEAPDTRAITSLITRVEVVAALGKAHREKRLNKSAASKARRCFEQEWDAADIAGIDLKETIVQHAAELAWKHGLKGYDAVHLASALYLREVGRGARTPADDPINIVFATFDKKLWKVARSEQLKPWPYPLP